jgi:MraZ protein
MLRGNALAKVDEKGRLKVPAAFRALIEPKFGSEYFVTSLRGESVRVYPMEVWSRFDPAVMRLRNAVNYYGQSASMDPQGRILIHPLLRESAGTRGEVAVIGQQEFLEVWNRSAFEERLARSPLTDQDLESLSRMGI